MLHTHFVEICFHFDITVLLVSSSRHPHQWIVPGGGMEPEGSLHTHTKSLFQNQDRKHRTYVFTLIVTETLEAWEDSVTVGRKRKWFKVDEAIRVLQSHKPVHADYLHRLTNTCGPVCNPTNCNVQSLKKTSAFITLLTQFLGVNRKDSLKLI
uniref:Uncharacterized protein n=1 Tax=Monopterus albus TaxID=43700 RepID=A0A3Q3JG94_MONAL